MFHTGSGDCINGKKMMMNGKNEEKRAGQLNNRDLYRK